MNNILITISIIALTILIITFLLFHNIRKKTHEVFFDKQLPNISRDFIQTIFDTSNNKQLNTTSLSTKILSNKLAIVMPNLNDNLFKQFPKILAFYQSQNTSNTYINKHFQYILQSLGTQTTYNNLKSQHSRIALAATLDYIFQVLNKSIINPDIIHEIVNHFHQEIYEQVGAKILDYIFNTGQTLTHIIKAIDHMIEFTIYDYNLIAITTITSMSLSATIEPNKVHYFNTAFYFYMSPAKNQETNDKFISYRNTIFTLFLPNTMKHYITKEKCNIRNTCSSFIRKDPDCAILHYHDQDEINPDISVLEYCLSDIKASSLFKNRIENNIQTL